MLPPLQETIGETLPLYERYCRIVNEAVPVKLLPIQNGVIVEFNFVGLSRHHFRQNAEFVLAANLKGAARNCGPKHPPNQSYVRTSAQFPPAGVGAILRLPCRVRLCVRPMVCIQTKHWPCRSSPRESISVGDAATLLRSGGKGAEHRPRDPAVFSRKRIAEAAAARQGQQTNRGEGAGDERANAVSQTGWRRPTTTNLSISCGEVSRSNTSKLRAYPCHKLRGCWAMKVSTSFNHAFVRWTGRSPSAARKEEQLPAVA